MNNPRAFENVRITIDATETDLSTTGVHKRNVGIAGPAFPPPSRAQKAAVWAVGKPRPRDVPPCVGRVSMVAVPLARRVAAGLEAM